MCAINFFFYIVNTHIADRTTNRIPFSLPIVDGATLQLSYADDAVGEEGIDHHQHVREPSHREETAARVRPKRCHGTGRRIVHDHLPRTGARCGV